jgi:hypothetical protein
LANNATITVSAGRRRQWGSEAQKINKAICKDVSMQYRKMPLNRVLTRCQNIVEKDTHRKGRDFFLHGIFTETLTTICNINKSDKKGEYLVDGWFIGGHKYNIPISTLGSRT